MAVLLGNVSSEISLIITRRFARRPPWCKYINALSGGLRHLIRPVVGDLATDRRSTSYTVPPLRTDDINTAPAEFSHNLPAAGGRRLNAAKEANCD